MKIADMKFDPPPPLCIDWSTAHPTFHVMCMCIRDEGHEGKHRCKCHAEWGSDDS